MPSSYYPPLVVLSVIVATFAAYTALDLAGRVTAARQAATAGESGGRWWPWLIGGAFAMGSGVWSMHFVGMLAFSLPVTMAYDVPRVLLSYGVAVAASALALWVVSGTALRARTLAGAGVAMGLGIAGMHYIGMAAIRAMALVHYAPSIVAASIAIAVVASTVALLLAYYFRNDQSTSGKLLKLGSALFMGLAIAGMHYTAMAAARFTVCATPPAPAGWLGELAHGTGLAVGISVATLLVLGLAAVSATIDRRAREATQAREELRRRHEETERLVAERTADLRVALEAAEVANRTKSDFLARMSHELRTPLNSVIGFANVMIRNRSGTFAEQDIGYLQRISANGSHLLALINQILDLAKIESGHSELVLAPVAVDAVVRDVVSQFDALVRDRTLVLQAEVPDHVASFETDDLKLRQILINLVNNALKFTESGHVRVRLAVDARGVPVSIEVTDSGIGIPPERLAAIFEPFEQVDTSTARRFGGTGLGLAISRSLCEILGYALTVRSTVDVGTTFTIGLSAAVQPTVASRNGIHDGAGVNTVDALVSAAHPVDDALFVTDVSEPSGDFVSVLIVEDDPDTRQLMMQYVRDAGVEVRTAGNGRVAMELLQHYTPHLILLDLAMPTMDGQEFLQCLHADARFTHTPVVIVTAQEMNREQRAKLASSTFGIVHKGADLEQRLHAVLGRVVGALAAGYADRVEVSAAGAARTSGGA